MYGELKLREVEALDAGSAFLACLRRACGLAVLARVELLRDRAEGELGLELDPGGDWEACGRSAVEDVMYSARTYAHEYESTELKEDVRNPHYM